MGRVGRVQRHDEGARENRLRQGDASSARESRGKLLLSLPRERPLLGRDLDDLFLHLMFREK